MANEPNSVADIFASLGLDASQLDQGLAQSKVKMNEFVHAIENLGKVAFDKLNVPFMAASAAAREAAKGADSYRVGLEKVKNELVEVLSLQEQQARLGRRAANPQGFDVFAPASSRYTESTGHADVVSGAIGRAERKRDAIEERRIQAESFAEARRIATQRRIEAHREVLSKREMANLNRQLRTEESTANAAEDRRLETQSRRETARIARRRADERGRVVESERDMRRLNSQLTRQQAQGVRSDRQNAGFPGGGDLQGMFGAWAGMSAVGDLMGIRIPMGASMLISRLGMVQKAMTAAFAPLVAFELIKTMKDMGIAIGDLVKDFVGLGAASEVTWDKIRADMADAMKFKLEIGDIDRRIAKEGEEDFKGNIAVREAEIQRLKVLKDARAADIEVVKKANELIYDPSKMTLALAMRASNYLQGKTVAQLDKEKTELQDQINQLTDDISRLQRQEILDKMKRDKEKDNTKRRDPYSEFPNRIPWFLSQNPSDAFASQFGMTATGSGIASLSGRGANQVVYNIRQEFNGMPADIRKFMRDHAGPALAEAITDNTRGLGSDMRKKLRK